MSSVTLSRASALALLLGSLLVLLGFVFRVLAAPSIPTPTQEASAQYVSSGVLGFSGVALLLFGWLGIVARLAAQTGWLGLAGALLIFLSGVVFSSISGYNFLASPWYAAHAPNAAAQVAAYGTPEVVVAAFVATWLIFGGAVLAEIAMLRARMFSAWAGLLIIVGAVFGLVFDYVLFNPFVFLVAVVLAILGLGWMAYALLTGKGEAPRQPVPTP